MGGGGGMMMAHNTQAMPHQNTAGPSHKPIDIQPLKSNIEHAASGKQIRGSAEYPLISVDIYGGGEVSYYPPDELGDELKIICVGKVSSDLKLVKSEKSYKAIKKMLKRGDEESFDRVFNESLADDDSGDTLIIPRPNLLMGARRISLLSDKIRSKYQCVEDSSHFEPLESHPVQIRNQTLDGEAVPRGNDFDRVALQIDLLPGKKKPIAILPEEAVVIILAKARKMVLEDIQNRFEGYEASESYMEYPIAIPLPGWITSDFGLEAYMELGNQEALMFHRPVAALIGGLNQKNKKLIQTVGASYVALQQSCEDKESFEGGPVVLAIGITDSGLELCSVQISRPSQGILSYTSFNIVSEVSYHHDQGVDVLEKALLQMEDNLTKYLPKNCQTPCAVVTFGDTDTQIQLNKKIKTFVETKKWACQMQVDQRSSKSLPTQVISTRSDATSIGACLLAGTSHQRIQESIDIKNVSTTAIGISVSYTGEKRLKLTDDDVKIIFDFDRRVPAGPYDIEMSAAECAAILRKGNSDATKEEIKNCTGGKNISIREDAAKEFRLQVLQKMERGGKWIPVGDVVAPLLKTKEQDDDDKDTKKERVCIESSILSLSVGKVGIITTNLSSTGDSIAQAQKSARWSTITYYFWVLFAILFFGGFLVKSYVEERVFNRDVQRLLKYYKIATPGGLQDGDKRNAQYLVYKYKNKKEKLWRMLEKKYDVPAPDNWDDWEHLENVDLDVPEEDDQDIDLDDQENEKGTGSDL